MNGDACGDRETVEEQLVAVLAGERPGTVLRATGVSAPTGGLEAGRAERLAARAGWRAVRLETTGVADKAALLARVQQDLALPDWFGRNWDALADALTEVGHPVGTLLVWTGWSELSEADPQAFATALEVLAERSTTTDGGRFAVVLAPPSPAARADRPGSRR